MILYGPEFRNLKCLRFPNPDGWLGENSLPERQDLQKFSLYLQMS